MPCTHEFANKKLPRNFSISMRFAAELVMIRVATTKILT